MKAAAKPPCSDASLGTVAHTVMGTTFKRADGFRDALVQAMLQPDRQTLDPEDIHQMRVNLRQLRSCLQIFRPHLCLAKAAQEPVVKAFAQSLGAVRDLDILQEKLKTHYLPILPDSEQRHLQKMLHQLERKRTRSLGTLCHRLRSDRYQQFKKAYRAWLKSPQFVSNAHQSFAFLAPDILLSSLSQWLQHPGWFVATIAEGGVYFPVSGLNLDVLRAQETEFHGLRKAIKQVRYQFVLLNPFLEETAAATVTAIVTPLKTFQEILGNLQDLAVIRTLMEAFLAQKGLPPETLQLCFKTLDEEYLALWRQWQPLQTQYLSPAFRFELRQQVAGLSFNRFDQDPLEQGLENKA